MIRINLLESITDKPTSAAIIVEKRVSNPASRFYLLSGVIAGLLVLAMGITYFDASQRKWTADEELVKQQAIAKELEGVLKEQEALEKKIKDIDERIKAIKDLRSSQDGPSRVLDALRERIVNSPGLYLESVEQKGGKLTIKGNSPNEYTVSGFGRSLEFSSGLFSNLSIATQRAALQAQQVQSMDGSPVQLGGDPNAAQPETVNFTIECAYTPSKADQSPLPNEQQPTNAPAAGRSQSSTAANSSTVNQTEVAKN